MVTSGDSLGRNNMMPFIPIDLIRVENRYRRHLGNLVALMDSIKALGLLHPILVNPKHKLIAGGRRLEACKRLGWKDIPVTMVSLDELRAEHDENVIRQDFLPSEAVAIKRALETVEKEKARERMSAGGRLSKKGTITCGKLPPLVKSNISDGLGEHGRMYQETLQWFLAGDVLSKPQSCGIEKTATLAGVLTISARFS